MRYRAAAAGFVLAAFLNIASATASDWMTVSFARERCLPEGVTTSDIARAKSGRCLESWTRLDRSLYAARYRMSSRDEPDVVTEVLFESPSMDGRVRPLWLTQATSDIYEIQRVTLHRVGKSRIVDVFGCLNGTGGCDQELVLCSSAEGCRKLENLRPKFNAALPRGYTTLKAPIARLDRMLIEGYGWKPEACNACASLEMTCHLSFDGQVFALARCSRRSLPE